MVKVSNLGYPRLGENREWKKLIESYWAGNISQDELQAQAKELRLEFLILAICTMSLYIYSNLSFINFNLI